LPRATAFFEYSAAQQGRFDGLLVDVDQVELEAGNRALQVVADVRADGAGADDGDGARQGAGGGGEQRIGVAGGHVDILVCGIQ
jgi:hypothetical protein